MDIVGGVSQFVTQGAAGAIQPAANLLNISVDSVQRALVRAGVFLVALVLVIIGFIAVASPASPT